VQKKQYLLQPKRHELYVATLSANFRPAEAPDCYSSQRTGLEISIGLRSLHMKKSQTKPRPYQRCGIFNPYILRTTGSSSHV